MDDTAAASSIIPLLPHPRRALEREQNESGAVGCARQGGPNRRDLGLATAASPGHRLSLIFNPCALVVR